MDELDTNRQLAKDLSGSCQKIWVVRVNNIWQDREKHLREHRDKAAIYLH